MKISTGGNISTAASEAVRLYPSQTYNMTQFQRGNRARRFDSITISGETGKYGAFEMDLRSRISQEVRTATTSGMVSALREQIQLGTYQPDPVGIAQKMLLTWEGA